MKNNPWLFPVCSNPFRAYPFPGKHPLRLAFKVSYLREDFKTKQFYNGKLTRSAIKYLMRTAKKLKEPFVLSVVVYDKKQRISEGNISAPFEGFVPLFSPRSHGWSHYIQDSPPGHLWPNIRTFQFQGALATRWKYYYPPGEMGRPPARRRILRANHAATPQPDVRIPSANIRGNAFAASTETIEQVLRGPR